MEPFRIKILNQTKLYYTPLPNLSIDEAMVLFTGYHPDRVYMPLKPIKYGIKIYVLAEAENGVILNYKICRRRENII